MKIRGKEYMEVKDRVMVFRTNHPEWAINTEIIENNESTGSVIFKAYIEDGEGRIRGVGHAHEFRDDKSSMVNKTSHLENCETSAIGRALGSLGIGIESSYASYDEVMIALDKESRSEEDKEKDKKDDDDRAEERKNIKEGTIKQSSNRAEDYIWPGKKKYHKETLGAIMKKDPEYLKEVLKTKEDILQDQDPKLLAAIKAVISKTDFPNAE